MYCITVLKRVRWWFRGMQHMEQSLLAQPWDEARPSVRAKLQPREGKLYVWVQSQARVHKERAMLRRQLSHAQ